MIDRTKKEGEKHGIASVSDGADTKYSQRDNTPHAVLCIKFHLDRIKDVCYNNDNKGAVLPFLRSFKFLNLVVHVQNGRLFFMFL